MQCSVNLIQAVLFIKERKVCVVVPHVEYLDKEVLHFTVAKASTIKEAPIS